jgi:hypothetical protein
MKIKYFTPYSLTKDIGEDYNNSMSLLENDEDWGVFLDGDAMFTTHNWGHHIESIIKDNPEAKLFTCMTNRVGTDYQCVENMWDENNISEHWKKGLYLQQEYKTQLIDITHNTPISGVLIALRKKEWAEVKGFQSGAGMLGVDNSIHYRFRDNGHKVFLAKGLYVLHYYRNGIRQNKQHLL